jgi:hypothetical protein
LRLLDRGTGGKEIRVAICSPEISPHSPSASASASSSPSHQRRDSKGAPHQYSPARRIGYCNLGTAARHETFSPRNVDMQKPSYRAGEIVVVVVSS